MSSFDYNSFEKLVDEAAQKNASDVHLVAGQAVFFRIKGELIVQEYAVPETDELGLLIDKLIPSERREAYSSCGDVDFALTVSGRRIRLNIYRQQGKPAIAIRLISDVIPTLEALGVPSVFLSLRRKESGLILVTGRTGAGKTTTIAAFLAELTETRANHIVTLEDPIEYILPPGKSLVSQREYETDFFSFADALKSAVREMPDIIVIGEMRDEETVAAAINAAETGHLVIASLHTQSAEETLLRIEGFFPAEQQAQVRTQLSLVLEAIVSQRLLPSTNGERVCAAEVLIATPAVRNIIRTGKVAQLKNAIVSGRGAGMQTTERAVEELYKRGKISADTASRYIEIN